MFIFVVTESVSNKTKLHCLYGQEIVSRDETWNCWQFWNENEYDTIQHRNIASKDVFTNNYDLNGDIRISTGAQLYILPHNGAFSLVSKYVIYATNLITSYGSTFKTICNRYNMAPTLVKLSVSCRLFGIHSMANVVCVLKRLRHCYTSAVIVCRDASVGLVTAPVTVCSAINLLS